MNEVLTETSADVEIAAAQFGSALMTAVSETMPGCVTITRPQDCTDPVHSRDCRNNLRCWKAQIQPSR